MFKLYVDGSLDRVVALYYHRTDPATAVSNNQRASHAMRAYVTAPAVTHTLRLPSVRSEYSL